MANRFCRWMVLRRRADPQPRDSPETAATLRRLMEGVILHGTGKARVSMAGRPPEKRAPPKRSIRTRNAIRRTNVIASFTGFAPINNPAVTILVSIDSPGGYPHGGGDVAAPVFKRIAEQVLPYLDVPRDVPVSPRLIQAAYHPGSDCGQRFLDDSLRWISMRNAIPGAD